MTYVKLSKYIKRLFKTNKVKTKYKVFSSETLDKIDLFDAVVYFIPKESFKSTNVYSMTGCSIKVSDARVLTKN